MPNDHQPFRQGPNGHLVYLKVFEEPETNQHVIYWKDITAVFPNAGHVKNGQAIVSFARNEQCKWCEPRCIRHYPGVVLEVFNVSSTGGDSQSPIPPKPTNLSAQTLLPSPASTALPSAPAPAPAQKIVLAKYLKDESTHPHLILKSLVLHETATTSVSSPVTAVATAASPTQHRALQPATMLLSSSVQLLDFERSARSGVIAKADAIVQGNVVIQQGIRVIQDELKENFPALRSEIAKSTALQQELASVQQQMLKLQERSTQMQQEALDRLALIQNKVAAIMTQNYELHEYPIPRLFIVLPKEDATMTETLGRGIKNLFSKQFKLYFLCECGDHTKPANGRPTNPSLKHEIHIARHEGYDIDHPTEFFDKYGSYILTLLQMLKYGVTIAGVVVPPLGKLKLVDELENIAEGIDHVLKDIGPRVDSSIEYIESLTGVQSQLESSASNTSPADLGGLEALEGADIRQLKSFLKARDKGRALGNLYRIITSEGHVKWVCLDHYRENYRAKSAQVLRDALKGIKGKYDEATGSIQVTLHTSDDARNFYLALKSSRSVQILYVNFKWAPSMQDLRDLRDAITSTNIIDITIRKGVSGTPISDVLNGGRRSDPLLQMLSGGNIRSFHLCEWDEGFLGRISTIPKTLAVRKLQIYSKENWTKQSSRLISILKASPLLSELLLDGYDLDLDGVVNPLLPELETINLPGELKLVIGGDDGSRACLEIEAFTGKVRSIDLRVDSDNHTKLLDQPLVRHIRFLDRPGLTPVLRGLQQRLSNNSGLESIQASCSQLDFISWLQAFHKVFAFYPQQTPRLQLLDGASVLSTNNIQDLSTTVIDLKFFSNYTLSEGYLGTIQDEWSFTVRKVVLEANTTLPDIAALEEFSQKRSNRLSFPALELTIDIKSDPTIMPTLIKLLKECRAFQNAKIKLDLSYAGTSQIFTDISCQDAVEHLSRHIATHISKRATTSRLTTCFRS